MSRQLTGGGNLVGSVVKLSKQKIIQATTVDVLGRLCSVRLSGSGALLTGLKYTGLAPKKGQIVQVDYRSGVPTVLTVADNIEAEIQSIVGTQMTKQFSSAYNQNSSPPLEPPDQGIPLSISDGSVVTPNVYQIIFPADTITVEEDGVVSVVFPDPGGGLSTYEEYIYEMVVADRPLNLPTAFIDGSLAVAANVFHWIAQEPGVFSSFLTHVKTPGSSGSTIVDINKNGSTIFSTSGNRPEFDHSDTGSIESAEPDEIHFVKGDVFSIDIDQVATGAAGLVVSPVSLGYSDISWTTEDGEIITETVTG